MSSNHHITNQLEDHEKRALILKADQNEALIVTSAIVELWLSKKSDHSEWSKLACGILCIVKKKIPKSDFFQLFDLEANVLWEEEIYQPFFYKAVTKNFHFFPAKEQNAGLNFAFGAEADNVIQHVEKNIGKQINDSKPVQIRKTHSFRETRNPSKNFDKQVLDNEKFNNKKVSDTTRLQKQKENKLNTIFNSQKEKARRFFSFRKPQQVKNDKPKLEISGPNDFRVVQQVRITGDSIKIDTKDEQTKQKINEILSKLNVKSNRRTEQFVGDFLKKIEVDSDIWEKIPELEQEEKNNYETKKNIDNRTNEVIFSKRASIQSLSIKPLVVQNQQSLEVSEKIGELSESTQATAKYVYDEPNMLDVLKTELEKRAQYLNQSDSDTYFSNEESESEWI